MKYQTDVTGIFNENFEQVFVKARPRKATVNIPSRIMNHPLEDRTESADFKILDLVTVQIPFLITGNDIKDTFQTIKKSYKESDIFTIQTKVDTYSNMIIESIPYEETAEISNGITVVISFKEVKFETAKVTYAPSPQRPQDESVKASGKQQTAETNETKKDSVIERTFF